MKIIAVLLLSTATCVVSFSNVSAVEVTLRAFPSAQAAADYFRVHTLPEGSPTSLATLHWVRDDHGGAMWNELMGSDASTTVEAELTPPTYNCALFQDVPIECRRSTDWEGRFFITSMFEPVPPWLHLFKEIAPLKGEASRPTGYYETDLSSGFLDAGDLSADGYLYQRNTTRLSRDDHRPPRMREIAGFADELDGSDFIYGTTLDLVNSRYVIGADSYWENIYSLYKSGKPFECNSSGFICAIVVQLDYPDKPVSDTVYGVCHVVAGKLRVTEVSLNPFNCDVLGYQRGSDRYILSLTTLQWVDGLGAGYNGNLALRGIGGESELRNLLAGTFTALGLQPLSGPRGPVIAAESPSGRYDENARQYLWRTVVAAYHYIDPDDWLITWSIYIHGSVRDEVGQQLNREDLVPALKDVMIKVVEDGLRENCPEVFADHADGWPTLVCFDGLSPR